MLQCNRQVLCGVRHFGSIATDISCDSDVKIVIFRTKPFIDFTLKNKSEKGKNNFVIISQKYIYNQATAYACVAIYSHYGPMLCIRNSMCVTLQLPPKYVLKENGKPLKKC